MTHFSYHHSPTLYSGYKWLNPSFMYSVILLLLIPCANQAQFNQSFISSIASFKFCPCVSHSPLTSLSTFSSSNSTYWATGWMAGTGENSRDRTSRRGSRMGMWRIARNMVPSVLPLLLLNLLPDWVPRLREGNRSPTLPLWRYSYGVWVCAYFSIPFCFFKLFFRILGSNTVNIFT